MEKAIAKTKIECGQEKEMALQRAGEKFGKEINRLKAR